MKDKYTISLIGCDDTTPISIELTEAEVEFIKELCRLSKEISTYACMPTMALDKAQE